jgi:hypothetical protein
VTTFVPLADELELELPLLLELLLLELVVLELLVLELLVLEELVLDVLLLEVLVLEELEIEGPEPIELEPQPPSTTSTPAHESKHRRIARALPTVETRARRI